MTSPTSTLFLLFFGLRMFGHELYQTRIVTKYEKPMLAEEDDETPSEQNACSMLCDDIPYELLAAGR